jgi:2-methylcitrate dehydratase PrpD
MTSSARLAAFAAELVLDDVPPGVQEHARLSLLDTVGCALFGSTLDWTRILRRALAGVEPGGPCGLWGTRERWSAPHAALVNGTAAHGFELDDLHPRSILHAGSVTLPAAVAVAELRGERSGARLLTAVIAGYEVGARVGMSVGAGHLLAGWHPTGTHGTFAAAVAAGVMLGLDAEAMSHALGLAGSQSGGLMAAQYGSMAKRLHAGRAAQSGVYAALLAAEGFTGIDDVLEAEYGGYCTTMAPAYDAAALTAGLGETWETAQIGFKAYPTNGSCHPSIDALLTLRTEHGLCAEDVDSVTLRVSSATKHHVGWPYEPVSITAAQMNLPYIAGAVLTDGMASIDQFTPERIRDPELLKRSARVSVLAAAEIDARGDAARHETHVELRLRDGRVLRATRTFAHGSARDPLTRAEVEGKFALLAGHALPDEGVQKLQQAIERVEVGDVAQLAAALRGSNS